MDDVLDVTEQDMKLVNLCKVSAQSKRLSELLIRSDIVYVFTRLTNFHQLPEE